MRKILHNLRKSHQRKSRKRKKRRKRNASKGNEKKAKKQEYRKTDLRGSKSNKKIPKKSWWGRLPSDGGTVYQNGLQLTLTMKLNSKS